MSLVWPDTSYKVFPWNLLIFRYFPKNLNLKILLRKTHNSFPYGSHVYTETVTDVCWLLRSVTYYVSLRIYATSHLDLRLVKGYFYLYYLGLPLQPHETNTFFLLINVLNIFWFRFLVDGCLMLFSRLLHSYDSGQHYVGREPGRSHGETHGYQHLVRQTVTQVRV